MRSESTRAFGQPRLTKPMRGMWPTNRAQRLAYGPSVRYALVPIERSFSVELYGLFEGEALFMDSLRHGTGAKATGCDPKGGSRFASVKRRSECLTL